MIETIISGISLIVFCIFIALIMAKNKSKYNSLEFFNLDIKTAIAQIILVICCAAILFFNKESATLMAVSFMAISIINHVFNILNSINMIKFIKKMGLE